MAWSGVYDNGWSRLVAAAARLWGRKQDHELTRQKRLHEERLWDAAAMGVVAADLDGLRRYNDKAKETHTR